jgi:hypothetical protein
MKDTYLIILITHNTARLKDKCFRTNADLTTGLIVYNKGHNNIISLKYSVIFNINVNIWVQFKGSESTNEDFLD